MSRDYIPASDGDFTVWAANFLTYAGGHKAALGINDGDVAPLLTMQADWAAAVANNEARQTAAIGARQEKDAKRAILEQAIRGLVRRLQASPQVDDNERGALGITIPDQTNTAATAAAATRPVGVVDTSQRLRHEIRFFDQATPTRRAKPAGVIGCEIWVKTGSPPADPAELKFIALDTASPYVIEHDGADAGKVAYYMLRWVTTRGEKGPWSETVAATITQ